MLESRRWGAQRENEDKLTLSSCYIISWLWIIDLSLSLSLCLCLCLSPGVSLLCQSEILLHSFSFDLSEVFVDAGNERKRNLLNCKNLSVRLFTYFAHRECLNNFIFSSSIEYSSSKCAWPLYPHTPCIIPEDFSQAFAGRWPGARVMHVLSDS